MEMVSDMIKGYYDYFEYNEPHGLVDLYRPGSIVAHMEDGVIVKKADNMKDIEALIMTWNISDVTYRCIPFPLENLKILVLVMGSLRSIHFVGRRKFAQIIVFVCNVDNGYYISNDIFSFVGEEYDKPSTNSSSNRTADNYSYLNPWRFSK